MLEYSGCRLSGSSPMPVVEVTTRNASGAKACTSASCARGLCQASRPAALSNCSAWPSMPWHFQAATSTRPCRWKPSVKVTKLSSARLGAPTVSKAGLATTRVSAWSSEGFKKAFGAQAAEAALTEEDWAVVASAFAGSVAAHAACAAKADALGGV